MQHWPGLDWTVSQQRLPLYALPLPGTVWNHNDRTTMTVCYSHCLGGGTPRAPYLQPVPGIRLVLQVSAFPQRSELVHDSRQALPQRQRHCHALPVGSAASLTARVPEGREKGMGPHKRAWSRHLPVGYALGR